MKSFGFIAFISVLFIAIGSSFANTDIEVNTRAETGGASIGAGHNSNNTINYNYNTPSEAEDEALGFNYMRLFGAKQVPLFMSIMSKKSTDFRPATQGGYYEVKGEGEVISEDLLNFWKNNWEYKNGKPIKNYLWEKYLLSIQAGTDAEWNAADFTKNDLLNFAKEAFMDYSLNEDLSAAMNRSIGKYNFLGDEVESSGSPVGYLFLIIDNLSSKPVKDIEIVYKRFSIENRFLSFSSEVEGIISQSKINELVEHKYNNPLGEDDVSNMSFSTEIKKSPFLKSGDSLLLLLAVYKKDDNGFPNFYLDDFYEPISVKYILNNKVIEQEVRKPYRETADRWDVPWGWYGQ